MKVQAQCAEFGENSRFRQRVFAKRRYFLGGLKQDDLLASTQKWLQKAQLLNETMLSRVDSKTGKAMALLEYFILTAENI